MIPTNKYLKTLDVLKNEHLNVFFDYHKSARTLNVYLAPLNELKITIMLKCNSDKQFDNYVKEFEICREKGDLTKFLKRVRSKVKRID